MYCYHKISAHQNIILKNLETGFEMRIKAMIVNYETKQTVFTMIFYFWAFWRCQKRMSTYGTSLHFAEWILQYAIHQFWVKGNNLTLYVAKQLRFLSPSRSNYQNVVSMWYWFWKCDRDQSLFLHWQCIKQVDVICDYFCRCSKDFRNVCKPTSVYIWTACCYKTVLHLKVIHPFYILDLKLFLEQLNGRGSVVRNVDSVSRRQ